ncbi:MAG: hypothetical protein HW412_2223, partial [Bacteroidetes bacterium]|nr:hypothetical protein [Bacteroidota bacterium]
EESSTPVSVANPRQAGTGSTIQQSPPAVRELAMRAGITPSILSELVPPDSIKVYRAVRAGGPYYLKRTLAGAPSSYGDSSAMPLRNYYYRVTAIYGNGESAYSNEAYGTVDSSFIQFAFTTPHRVGTPIIDGILGPNEWVDAIRIDVSDVFGYGGGIQLPRGSVFMWFKYDSLVNRLYIAGEDILNNDGLADGEGFGLYFDDNHNHQFESIGGDSLLREGNYWGYYFSAGPNVRFRVIYTGGGVGGTEVVTDAQAAFSSATGHVTGEVSIPLGFFNRNHLQVYGPNRFVGAGLFMIGRTGNGAALFHGWWPQTMVSVFTPSGFGDIHIPIRLLGEPVSVKEGTETPKEFTLLQNYPNPFNPSTKISFQLPAVSFVTLRVFDLLGREVGTLVNKEMEAGSHSVTWDAADVSAGVYFYKLQAGAFGDVKKLLVLK